MQRQLIQRGKNAVFIQDHQQLKKLYTETHNLDYQLNMADIFLQLFYYACQHNRQATIIFLLQMYYEIFSETGENCTKTKFLLWKIQNKKEEFIFLV